MNSSTNNDQVQATQRALRSWLRMHGTVRPSNSLERIVNHNNRTYLFAFMEANDDLFDHSFRRSVMDLLGMPYRIEDDLRSQVEIAVSSLRHDERARTFSGGVIPAVDSQFPAYMAVERVLASAPTSDHRRATRTSWEKSLDANADSVRELAETIRRFRTRKGVQAAKKGVADQFVKGFMDETVRAINHSFAVSRPPASGNTVQAAEVALEEGPSLVLRLANESKEPLLDVSLVVATLQERVESITGDIVSVCQTDNYWEFEFSTPVSNVDSEKTTSTVVIWPFITNQMSPVSRDEVNGKSFSRPGVPTAHIGLRCIYLPDKRLVMRLRDLKTTLHEVGHAISHAITARFKPWTHGLMATGETEIDLLSLWVEWEVYGSYWERCIISSNHERFLADSLQLWQDLLKIESFIDLPIRALTMSIDLAWASSPDLTYSEVWKQVTGLPPSDHTSTYIETLHRLAWPIPMTRPGAEYGLFWTMAEVLHLRSERSKNKSTDASVPSEWIGRILGAEHPTAPDIRSLVDFFKTNRPNGQNCLTTHSTEFGVQVSTTRDYPTDYIAAMLPDRDPQLTDILHKAFVDEKLPPVHVDDNAAHLLRCLSLIAKPRLIVEIGTLFGYSAIHLAQGLTSGGRLISYEVDARIAGIARENIERLDLVDRVEIVAEDALVALPKLQAESADIIFVDGKKSEYVSYLKAAFPILAPGGLLIIDDAFAGGSYAAYEGTDDTTASSNIRKVVRALARSARVSVAFVGTEHGMFLAVKNGGE